MRQGGDKCKLMRHKEPRVGDKCGRQVWKTSVGDKWEASVNSCAPRHPETPVGDTCGKQVGDTCKIMRPKTPRVRDKCGRQVEDKCKLMWPKAPRVGDKCGRQV